MIVEPDLIDCDDLRVEIAAAIKLKHISSNDFAIVNLYQYDAILKRIANRFLLNGCHDLKYRWLWEHFKSPKTAAYGNNCAENLATLKQLIPAHETIWFIASDDHNHDKRLVYQGKINSIIDVLGELHFVEYYLVSKKLDWLLCEDHHNLIHACGKIMVDKIEALNRSLSA